MLNIMFWKVTTHMFIAVECKWPSDSFPAYIATNHVPWTYQQQQAIPPPLGIPKFELVLDRPIPCFAIESQATDPYLSSCFIDFTGSRVVAKYVELLQMTDEFLDWTTI
jgi:hypothetical protein